MDRIFVLIRVFLPLLLGGSHFKGAPLNQNHSERDSFDGEDDRRVSIIDVIVLRLVAFLSAGKQKY